MQVADSRIFIRPFKETDAPRVVEIRKLNLERADRKDYSEEIIQRMINNLSIENMKEIAKEPNRTILVAYNISNSRQEVLLGSVCLVDNSVRLMFVTPVFHRNGIGTALMKRIEQIAREKGIVSLQLKSTLLAEKFYVKLGFVKRGEENKEMGPVILMEKELSPNP